MYLQGWQAAIAAYGYELCNGKIQLNPAQSAIVRRIFQEYLSGDNMRVIIERLNADNIPVKSADPEQKWTINSLSYILSNEKYIGDSLWQKTYRTDTFPRIRHINRGEQPQYYAEQTHPPIISKEMFQQVQQLKQHRLQKNGSRIPLRPRI